MLSIVFLSTHLIAPVSRDVTFTGAGGLELKGTFTAPAGLKKGRAFLLIPGSGPTDRDGNQPGLRVDLLKQIAEYLADHGFVSLRFDKRAVIRYRSSWPATVEKQSEFFKWENFVGDAKAALSFLRKQSEVDPVRTGVVGHSEGGLITLQIASDTAGKEDAPAAIVLIGTAGRRLNLVIHDQVKAAVDRSPLPADSKKQYMDFTDNAMAQLAKDGTVPPNCPPGLESLFPANAGKLMKSYFTTDPVKLASTFQDPVLLMNGASDVQVSPTSDFPLLKAVFEKRTLALFMSLLVPNASHNLKTVTGPADPGIEGPVAPVALKTLVDWATAVWIT